MNNLTITDLNVSFNINNQSINAVSNVNFSIDQGEILGIVGESGCGKSMTALSLIGLLPDNAKLTVDSITLDENDLSTMSEKELRKIRGNDISMIFQEPMTSLNPLIKVGRQITEAVKLHSNLNVYNAKQKTYKIMTAVGLPDVKNTYHRFPHELSGGMRQRIMIAMAMVLNPKLLIADEPTTALDVTIQAQILDLMKNLNREFGTSILFISHDFGVIKQMCDTVMVMYMGYIVEKASSHNIIFEPLHPYTKGLIHSIPNPHSNHKNLYSIPGSVPSIEDKPKGCPFAPRCHQAEKICFDCMPELKEVNTSHMVRCHLV